MAKRGDEQLAQAWQELMSRYHRVTCVLDSTLEEQHGISASEFAVLERLSEAKPEHALKMNELGDHAHLSQSALSRLVARLEADGLVERALQPGDSLRLTFDVHLGQRGFPLRTRAALRRVER